MIRNTPFALPVRPPATQVRQIDKSALLAPAGRRTMPMRGFEGKFVDIVDYIVRITDEIWTDRAIGRIYDTYDASCTIYSPYGVTRSVKEVVENTIETMAAFPEDEALHLNVAWSGDDQNFYTSHLGWLRATNRGSSKWGPATGKGISYHFVADCISRENRIHTEWLVHDAGALVRSLGLTIDAAARIVAGQTQPETLIVVPASPEVRPDPQDGRCATVDGWMRSFFHDIWTSQRLDRMADVYAPGATANWAGGRVAAGPKNIGKLVAATMAALPNATLEVQHVCWSDERDGTVVAVRWQLSGPTRRGGILGDMLPDRRFITIPGISHFRFKQGLIVEEWTVFDEVAAVAQALVVN